MLRILNLNRLNCIMKEENTAQQTSTNASETHASKAWACFTPQSWFSQFGHKVQHKPLNRSDVDVLRRLAGTNEVLKKKEIRQMYYPLAGLILSNYRAQINSRTKKTPYIIGISGSVAVGKSTGARVITELLRREALNVELITTDNFLKPNSRLEDEGLLRRKGFPESYDETVIEKFKSDLESDKHLFTIPTYDHIAYTILPDVMQKIQRPDILVLEGVNVLQRDDFPLDFSLYFDADTQDIKTWYIKRFLSFRNNAFAKPGAYFNRFATLSDDEAVDVASDLWDKINLVNFNNYIAPSAKKADCILHKAANHSINSVHLTTAMHQ